eukprot:SAG31_NODE_2655_length_5290_cov_14.429204_1_plen_499_part_10
MRRKCARQQLEQKCRDIRAYTELEQSSILSRSELQSQLQEVQAQNLQLQDAHHHELQLLEQHVRAEQKRHKDKIQEVKQAHEAALATLHQKNAMVSNECERKIHDITHAYQTEKVQLENQFQKILQAEKCKELKRGKAAGWDAAEAEFRALLANETQLSVNSSRLGQHNCSTESNEKAKLGQLSAREKHSRSAIDSESNDTWLSGSVVISCDSLHAPWGEQHKPQQALDNKWQRSEIIHGASMQQLLETPAIPLADKSLVNAEARIRLQESLTNGNLLSATAGSSIEQLQNMLQMKEEELLRAEEVIEQEMQARFVAEAKARELSRSPTAVQEEAQAVANQATPGPGTGTGLDGASQEHGLWSGEEHAKLRAQGALYEFALRSVEEEVALRDEEHDAAEERAAAAENRAQAALERLEGIEEEIHLRLSEQSSTLQQQAAEAALRSAIEREYDEKFRAATGLISTQSAGSSIEQLQNMLQMKEEELLRAEEVIEQEMQAR